MTAPKKTMTALEATTPEGRALFSDGCGFWLCYRGRELENWPRANDDGTITVVTQNHRGFARFDRVQPDTRLSLRVMR